MRKRTTLAAVALALALAGGTSAQTVVNADVTANTTWCSGGNPGPIILQRPIFVKDGATLTILPGCIVRGQPRTGPVVPGSTVGSPGALIVTANGRIVANGNAANPIIFTTAAVDDSPNDNIPDDVAPADGFRDAWLPGDLFLDDAPQTAPLSPLNPAGAANVALWGGLVVLGNAPVNVGTGCASAALGTCTVEGLTIPGFSIADSTYGGILPHDSSGSLQFVSVRHAGDEVGLGNELNGVTLAGIGDGTTLRNVEVYANFDDGIEWFGGNVNGTNLAVFFVGDDMFDVDQGYTGVNQFMFGIATFFNQNSGAVYGSASGDKGGEWDGDDFAEVGGANVQSDGTCRPLSYPQMYNMTLIGSAPPAGQHFTPSSPKTNSGAIQMRNGFAGELLNSIVVNTGTQAGLLTGAEVTACPGQNVADNIADCVTQVLASTFDDTGALAGTSPAALACGDADPRTPTALSNNCSPGSLFTNLVNEDVTFDPTGNGGKLDATLKPPAAKIKPKTDPGSIACTAGGVPGPRVVTFRGAFDGSLAGLWTDTWTVLAKAGLLTGAP